MNAKDEIGEAIIFKQLVAKVRDLQDEVAAKDAEVQAFADAIKLQGDGASKDMQYIYELEAKIKALKKEIRQADKRHTTVKRRMFDDFKAEQRKQERKYKRFKSLAERELALKD